MDIKKILALTIIVLALFSCMSVASAGLFDFLSGEPQINNATYTFDGFTLTLPDNANVTNNTTEQSGLLIKESNFQYSNDGKNSTLLTVDVVSGSNLVKSVDEYKANWLVDGAKDEGNYSQWSIININGVPITELSEYNLNLTYSGYILAHHTGSKNILLEGNNLTELKKVADTYKEI